MRNSLTHNKRYKQLQNSLWLRIFGGSTAFMQSRLNNSTKFHFGNDFKTNANANRNGNRNNNNQIYNNNNNNKETKLHHSKNRAKSPLLVDTDKRFHSWPWPCSDPALIQQSIQQQQQQNGSTTAILPEMEQLFVQFGNHILQSIQIGSIGRCHIILRW